MDKNNAMAVVGKNKSKKKHEEGEEKKATKWEGKKAAKCTNNKLDIEEEAYLAVKRKKKKTSSHTQKFKEEDFENM